MKSILNRIKDIDRTDWAWIIGGTLFVVGGTAVITIGTMVAIDRFISNLPF